MHFTCPYKASDLYLGEKGFRGGNEPGSGCPCLSVVICVPGRGHNMKKLLLILLSVNVQAFDIDGLNTQMPREEAIAHLKSFGLTIEDKKDKVLAYQSGRFYSLGFCNGTLVQVQKDLKATFETFVELAMRFKKMHGSPVWILPETPEPESSTLKYKLSIAWRDQDELITIMHIAFASHNQTSVIYEVNNSCFSNPLLSP